MPTIDSRFDRISNVTFLTGDQRVHRPEFGPSPSHYLDIPRHLRAGDEMHFSFLTRDIESVEAEFIVNDYTSAQPRSRSTSKSRGQVRFMAHAFFRTTPPDCLEPWPVSR